MGDATGGSRRIDLQLFNASQTGSTQADSGSNSGGADRQTAQNPLLTEPADSGGQALKEPVEVEQQSNLASAPAKILDFGGRRLDLNNLDPAMLEGLYQDWSNQTRTLQAMQAKVKELEQKVATSSQPPAESEPPGLTWEELQRMKNEELNELFYEEPKKVLEAIRRDAEKAARQAIDPLISPYRRQQEIMAELQDLQTRFVDLGQMVPQMQALLQQDEALAQRVQERQASMEDVYWRAKAKVAETAQGQTVSAASLLTPENLPKLLEDPQLRQALLANPQLQQEAIKYLSARQQLNQGPTPMGDQAGGSVPAMPPNQPKSLRDCTKNWAATGYQ